MESSARDTSEAFAAGLRANREVVKQAADSLMVQLVRGYWAEMDRRRYLIRRRLFGLRIEVWR